MSHTFDRDSMISDIYIYIYIVTGSSIRPARGGYQANKLSADPLPARPSGHVCAWGLVMGTRLRGPLASVAESFSATPAAEESSNLVLGAQKHGQYRL